MDIVMRDNHVRASGQLATNRHIKLIQEGLARFMETCDPSASYTLTHFCATLRAQDEHTNHTIGSPDKISLRIIILHVPCESNQTSRAHARRREARDLNQRLTHENGNGNGSDTQQPTMNTSSGLNNKTTHHSSSPKVPIFDGTVSAQFSPLAHTV